LFIADEEGFFADEGIRLEFETVSSNSTQAIPALTRRKVDALAAAVSPGLFNAISEGAGIRVVADKVHVLPDGCAYSAVLGNRERYASSAVDAAQLRGARFSVSAAAVAGYTAARYLESFGLTLADVEVVTLPETAGPQALESGSIDLIVATEPWLTQLAGKSRLLATANTLVPRLQLSALVFGPSLLRDDRDRATKFLRAYLRGIERLNQGPTRRNIEILSRRMQLDTAVLAATCWPPVRADGSVDTASIREFQEWAAREGNLKRVVPPSEYLDDALLAAARNSLR
jgi:ABC-type nitrate/sulfonate/bicarbonate transport system substrate-binding protein